jgi:hypothetical protein
MSRLKARMSSLSHDELLELAAAGCAMDKELRNRADALMAKRNPLPSWCVDIMLSPDLLPRVLEHTTLGDKAAATVSRVWAEAWSALMRRRRLLRPQSMQTLRYRHANNVKVQPLCGHVMSDGKIIVADFSNRGKKGLDRMRLEILSPDGETLQPGALRHWRFNFPDALLEHNGCLFVADSRTNFFPHSRGGKVCKLRLSDGEDMGSVELGLSEPGCVDGPCALAISGEELYVALGDHICVLDLQTLQTRRKFGHEFFLDDEGDGDSVCSCTIHDGEVYVADHRKLGEVQVFDRAGLRHRTIRGDFHYPHAVASHNGRLFLLEIEHNAEFEEAVPGCEWFGRRLLVLSADGAVLQSIHLPDDAYDIRSMSFRDVHTPDGTVTEAHLYAMHGAAVYVLGLVELSSMQDAIAGSSAPVSSRLRSRRLRSVAGR